MAELPIQILSQIFHRLPVKSLAACTCVCKAWTALIKSPAFLAAHLRKALAASTAPTSSAPAPPPNPPLLLLRLCTGPEEQYTLYSFPGTPTTHSAAADTSSRSSPPLTLFRSIPTPPLTALPVNGFFRVAGSCVGLVLLVDDLLEFTHRIVLWNPTTRRLLHLPDPPIRRDTHGQYESCLGLGYDDVNNDFKVLRVIFLMPNGGSARFRAEIYTVKTGKWKPLVGPAPRYALAAPRGQMAFFNDYIHYAGWMAASGASGKVTNVVLAFHVHNEQFRRIKFPNALSSKESISNTIFPYHGPQAPNATASRPSIAMFHVPNNPFHLQWEVWVMSEYADSNSWVRLAKTDNPIITHPLAILPPGLLVGGSPTGNVVGVELPAAARIPFRKVDLGLQGLRFIFSDVEGAFRTNIPTSGVTYTETLALADVVDPRRLVVYKASDEAPEPEAAPPESSGTADELDTQELISAFGGLLGQHISVFGEALADENNPISKFFFRQNRH